MNYLHYILQRGLVSAKMSLSSALFLPQSSPVQQQDQRGHFLLPILNMEGWRFL